LFVVLCVFLSRQSIKEPQSIHLQQRNFVMGVSLVYLFTVVGVGCKSRNTNLLFGVGVYEIVTTTLLIVGFEIGSTAG